MKAWPWYRWLSAIGGGLIGLTYLIWCVILVLTGDSAPTDTGFHFVPEESRDRSEWKTDLGGALGYITFEGLIIIAVILYWTKRAKSGNIATEKIYLNHFLSLLLFGIFSTSLGASALKGLFALVAILRWDSGPIPITAASVLNVGTEKIAPTIEQAFDLGFPVVEVPAAALRGEPGYYSLSPGNWCQSDPSAVGGRHVKGQGTVKYECFLRHDVGPEVTHRYYSSYGSASQILYDIKTNDFEVHEIGSGKIWRTGRISSHHWFITIDILQFIFPCSNIVCVRGDFSLASATFLASRPY